MDRIRRKQINELADNVRHALGLTVPINVEHAVEKLCGVIKYDPNLEYEAKIEKKHDPAFEIVLRDGSPNRMRFSIAHELGHLFIHMGYAIDWDKWNRIDDYEDSVYHRYGHFEEEYEANEFAGALLMPAEEFKSVAADSFQGNAYDLRPIAERFGVSIDAVRTRGRWLGLFSWDKPF